MEQNTISSLEKFERDFISFQKILPKLRETNPNQFVAFTSGDVISSGTSFEKVVRDVESRGFNPSGTVIEFVSKEEIRMVV